jgi:hypothetical protein
MRYKKHEFALKSWTVSGLSGDIVRDGDQVFLSIHHYLLDGDTLGPLIAASEPFPVNAAQVTALVDNIAIRDAHLIMIILHSISLGRAFGSVGPFLLDSQLKNQTHESAVEIDVPAFSSVSFACNIACIPEVGIIVYPLVTCIGDYQRFGGLKVPGRCGHEYTLTVRVVRRRSSDGVVAERRVENIMSKPILNFETIGSCMEPIELIFKLSDEDFFVDIQLVSMENVAVNEEIAIKNLNFDVPIIVGQRFGILAMTTSDVPKRIQAPPYITTVGDWIFTRSYKWTITIDFLPIADARIEYSSIYEGDGENSVLLMDTQSSVLASGRNVSFSLHARVIDSGPVRCTGKVAILIRQQSGKLFGIYTVPLVVSDRFVIDGEEFVFSVTQEQGPDGYDTDYSDESGIISLILPTRPENKHVSVPSIGQPIRIYLTIESGLGFTVNRNDSVFIEVMSVSLTVPPVLIIRSASDKLVTHANTNQRIGNAFRMEWHEETRLDIEWGENVWIYFIAYVQKENETVSLGHTCLSLTSIWQKEKSRCELPVIKSEPDANQMDSIPRLIVTSHKSGIIWSPISIYQSPNCRLEAVDEVRLDAHIFFGPDECSPIRNGHVWLPIKDIYPLYIRDCPTEGIIELTISSVKGRVLDKKRFSFGMRDKWDIICKGIHFVLTRSSQRPVHDT